MKKSVMRPLRETRKLCLRNTRRNVNLNFQIGRSVSFLSFMKKNIKSDWLRKAFALLAGLALAVAPGRAADPAPAAANAPADNLSGQVVDTINTAGYTYVQVDTGGRKIWAATPTFTVTKGDRVTVFGGLPMANYHSKSLNRDFDVVYFTGKITVDSGATATAGSGAGAGAAPVLPPGHPALPGQASPALPPNHPSLTGAAAAPAKVDLTGIKKAAGGKTIKEIFAASTKLAGHPVTVRGKVVKYNAMILGKNWLHIQDGSGSAEKNNQDLTVTTTTPAKLGDTVLVTGNVSTNKDFGAGYKYSVILDDAQVRVE